MSLNNKQPSTVILPMGLQNLGLTLTLPYLLDRRVDTGQCSAYTVVRAMCQVNGGWSILTAGSPKPLNRFTWNLARLITSTVWSHKQRRWPLRRRGEMGEVIPSHDSFLSLFGSFNASTAYPEKRGFSLSASKRCFGSVCVRLGLVCWRSQIFPLLPI